MVDKVRENRLRRMAQRRLLRLEKSRRRDPRAADFGSYMVIDHRNTVVLGATHNGYSATLDDVEAYLINRRSHNRQRLNDQSDRVERIVRARLDKLINEINAKYPDVGDTLLCINILENDQSRRARP